MAGLDLDGIRRVVESILDDQILVTRDPAGRSDDVLDDRTGALRPSTSVTVWSGRGAVTAGSPAVSDPIDGAHIAVRPITTTYQALIPVDAPALHRDDQLVITGSLRSAGPRDPLLLGRTFRVAGTAVSSFAIVRIVRLQET
ncbi:DUF6093 family protein [Streptomyces luteireticuli]|uniref:DUF6093 family protein n=1 Tax=Streptomyces luteireticuli TaxID=173858 RepID=UPI0035583AFC